MVRTDVGLGLVPIDDQAFLAEALRAEFGKVTHFRAAPGKPGWSLVSFAEVTRIAVEMQGRAFVTGFVAGRESSRNEQQRKPKRATRDARIVPAVLLDEVGGVRGQVAHAG